MKKKIRKVIIPAAGLGTRFLPATKAQPKEMLPIVDKPVIQYIIEECVAAGIEDIILVTNTNKRALEDHFDHSPELYNFLKENNKESYIPDVKAIADMANFIFIRQKGKYGNGTPILNAAHLIGDEPFAVVYGDDIFRSQGKNRMQELIEAYENYESCILTLAHTNDAGTKQYGIIEGESVADKIWKIEKLMEKPGPDATTSRIATLGGYILEPNIFGYLNTVAETEKGEIGLANAIGLLSKENAVYGVEVESKYYDIGSKAGFIKANMDFALEREDMKEELKQYIKDLAQTL